MQQSSIPRLWLGLIFGPIVLLFLSVSNTLASSSLIDQTDTTQELWAGGSQTCAQTTSGDIKCWGGNGFGQLGDGSTQDGLTPIDATEISNDVDAMALRSGAHTCIVTTGGGVQCWGGNWSGQLGNGTTVNSLTPVNVLGLSSGVSAIAAYGSHTCALMNVGTVKCWGDNERGQLGNGTTTDSTTPVNVTGLTNATSISAGWGYACAVLSTGTAKCWGRNSFGQLGDGTHTDQHTPVSAVGLSDATSIVTGSEHTCVTTSGGGAKCWGHNGDGHLGDGTKIDRPTPVSVVGLNDVINLSAGVAHNCVTTSSGIMRCWGNNSYGQLGDGTRTHRTTPVEVSGLSGSVTQVGAGGWHSCALTSQNDIFCWGSNSYGQLGIGTKTNGSIPQDVNGLTSGVVSMGLGSEHSCAVVTGGAAKCWGRNDEGQLGLGWVSDTYEGVDVPSNVQGLTTSAATVTANEDHSCALTQSGGVKCWGIVYIGVHPLVYGPSPQDITGVTSGTISVVAGGAHMCAITSGGGVKCWGSNTGGQLGNGTGTRSEIAVDVSGLASGVESLTAGSEHTCVVTISGGAKCWGANYSGSLGDGTTQERQAPVDVSGLTSNVKAIAAGGSHTCALTDGGAVKCWGSNDSGELGDGTNEDRHTLVNVSGLTSGVVAIAAAASSSHTCALMATGTVKCWGHNGVGQLGDGSYTHSNTPVDVHDLNNSIAIAGGGLHNCALTAGGGMKCWGSNDDNFLGYVTHIVPTKVHWPAAQPQPSLQTNHDTGAPGSYFTIQASGFPTGSSAEITVNSVSVQTKTTDAQGELRFALDTSGLAPGPYQVLVSVNPTATVSFILDNGEPYREREGDEPIIELVGPLTGAYPVYLPLIKR